MIQAKSEKINWWKVAGAVVLTHIILIALSILETTIYSYLVNPGQPLEVYQRHAEMAGPWISSIFGSAIIFFFVYKLNKGKTVNPFIIGIALPVAYTVIDIAILIVMGFDAGMLPSVLGFSTVKIAAGVIAAYWVKRMRVQAK
jgi:hypothetical protein